MMSALRSICRRSYSCKSRAFPDHPCLPMDPKCHRVPSGNCEAARNKLEHELPYNSLLKQQKELVPKCCVLRSASRKPCEPLKRPKQVKTPREPFRSMWEAPCRTREQPFCKDMLPRFDAIYYQPSYKCRCFQRTWAECPPVKQRLKKVCCLDGIHPPEVQYRLKEACPKICGVDYKRLRQMCLAEEEEMDPNKYCPKVYSPCCKKLSRCNPTCKRIRRKTKCTKLRAPYPSYSERVRPGRPLPSAECRCLDTVPICLAVRREIRRNNLNLKLF